MFVAGSVTGLLGGVIPSYPARVWQRLGKGVGLGHQCLPATQPKEHKGAGLAGQTAQTWHCPGVARAAADQGPTASSDDASYVDAREQGYTQAMLLAWFAMQQKSLFAAKCLVETVIEAYRDGYTLDDIKMSLSLSGLGYGGKLLAPLDEDILLSWVAIVMMTLKTVGVPPYPEGEARLAARGSSELTESTSRMTLGLQMFVKQSLDLFLSGTSLHQLQLQQSIAGQLTSMEGGEEVRGPSPAVQVMQQNTRLVIITLEVVRALGLPTDISLQQTPPPDSAAEDSQEEEEEQLLQLQDQEEGEEGPLSPPPSPTSSWDAAVAGGSSAAAARAAVVGYVPAFVPPRQQQQASAGSGSSSSSSDSSADEEEAVQKRAAAVRLLVSFIGASLGGLYSAWAFIDAAADCYLRGWTADELFMQLKDEEFAQSGGVFPVGVAGMGSPERISASLFANWLSLVYITVAQLGVPYPGAEEQQGWAWVCSLNTDSSSGPSALQAQGIADFVSNTLRLEAQREAAESGTSASAGEGGNLAGVAAGSAAAQQLVSAGAGDAVPPGNRSQAREGFSLTYVEDPALAKTSGAMLIISQQISLVAMTRQRVLAAAAAAQGPATVAA